MFIRLNRAYEFLDKEENRHLYAQQIKSIKEQSERVAAMNQERQNWIEDLRQREEERDKRAA